MRKHLKKGLVFGGVFLIVLGIILGAINSTEGPEESIWEKVDEEENTYFKETEQKENMGFDEPVQSIEYGELEQSTEESAPAAGEINELTYDDAQLLMKVAQAEAGNQGEEGMWLVMSVVMNRKENHSFPDTIRAVIYQDHQFATVSNGSIDKVELSAECHEALARIESGDIAPQIIAFETIESSALDEYFTRAFEFRDHRFYTKKCE